MDVVLDGIGGRVALRSYRVLRRGGRLVMFGHYSTLVGGRKSVRRMAVFYLSGAMVCAASLPFLNGLSLTLLSHRVVTGRQSGINRERLVRVVGTDWGWYTTVSDNLVKVAKRLTTVGLDQAARQLVAGRLAEVRDAMESAPKSLRWRARARIGRRVPWYDLPEEVG